MIGRPTLMDTGTLSLLILNMPPIQHPPIPTIRTMTDTTRHAYYLALLQYHHRTGKPLIRPPTTNTKPGCPRC